MAARFSTPEATPAVNHTPSGTPKRNKSQRRSATPNRSSEKPPTPELEVRTIDGLLLVNGEVANDASALRRDADKPSRRAIDERIPEDEDGAWTATADGQSEWHSRDGRWRNMRATYQHLEQDQWVDCEIDMVDGKWVAFVAETEEDKFGYFPVFERMDNGILVPTEPLPKYWCPTAEFLQRLSEATPPSKAGWVAGRPPLDAAMLAIGHGHAGVLPYSNMSHVRYHKCPVKDCKNSLSNPQQYELCVKAGHFVLCKAHGYGTALRGTRRCPACESIFNNMAARRNPPEGAENTPRKRKK